jgi:hypothetical protein
MAYMRMEALGGLRHARLEGAMYPSLHWIDGLAHTLAIRVLSHKTEVL